MPERPTMIGDLGHVVGAVRQVVESGDAGRGHFPQRDRNLAVLHVRRGQHACHRHVTIGSGDMQFLADPARRVALRVAFRSSFPFPNSAISTQLPAPASTANRHWSSISSSG